MSGLEVITAPTIEPISRIEAREHLRLDDDIDDSQVRAYITAARLWAEKFTGRTFINTTFRQNLDGYTANYEPYWEGMKTGPSQVVYSNCLELAASPASSVTHIKYYDDADTESTWAASNYYVDKVGDVGKIHLRDGGTYPSDLRASNAIQITFVAGYGASPNDVPEPIRTAILQVMTYLYENRGDTDEVKVPQIIAALLNPYKVMRFGNTPYNQIMRSGIG